MALIPLYGYIPNPNKPHEGDPLYVIKELQISPTLFEYRGVIGHGYHEGEFTEEDRNSDRVVADPAYPIQFIKYDMRDFVFTYDTEKREVTVKTYWRFESYEQEAKSLTFPIESDVVDDDPDGESYPYFRFPRTKDGIALSRVFQTIFNGKSISVFAPKEYLG